MVILLKLILVLVVLIMWNVFSTVFFKVYATPFGRRILMLFGLQITMVGLMFFIDDFQSVGSQGRFMALSTIASFAQIFGVTISASPIKNVISSMVFLLIPIFIGKPLIKWWLKSRKLGVIENGTLKLSLENQSVIFSEAFIKTCLIYGILLAGLEEGLLFNFVVYSKQLPHLFFTFLIILALLYICYAFIFAFELKQQSDSVLIQGIFTEPAQYREVITLFGIVEQGKKASFNSKNLTEKVELFVEMGIFKVPKLLKKELFSETDKIRILIDSKYLAEFKKFRTMNKKRNEQT